MLKSDGRRLSLIWACLGIFAFIMGGALAGIYAQNAVINLLEYRELGELWIGLFVWLSNMVFFGILVFLLLPLLTGIIPFAVTVVDGRADASLLFRPFSDATAYGHALALMWSFLWRVTAAAAVMLPIIGIVSTQFTDEAWPDWVEWILFVIFAVILLMTMMLSGGTFLTPYLAAVHPEKSLREYRKTSRAAASGYYFEIFFFRLFFVVMAVLSLLTVGITLLACVAPLLLTAYVIAARRLLANIDESERSTDTI